MSCPQTVFYSDFDSLEKKNENNWSPNKYGDIYMTKNYIVGLHPPKKKKQKTKKNYAVRR